MIAGSNIGGLLRILTRFQSTYIHVYYIIPTITCHMTAQARRKHGYCVSVSATSLEAVMLLSGDGSDGNILIPTERGDGLGNSALVGECHTEANTQRLGQL